MQLDSVPQAADVAQIVDQFRRLSTLCRAWDFSLTGARAQIARGVLPKPSYLLGNDLEFVPDDYFVFPAQAIPEQRKAVFIERYSLACRDGGYPLTTARAVQDAWSEYISGVTATYLRVLLPEAVARKTCLVHCIEGLIAASLVHDSVWRRDLAQQVDALDSLLRPVIPCDRNQSDCETVRDIYVTNVRQTMLVPEALEV